jgi:hypothetical protein
MRWDAQHLLAARDSAPLESLSSLERSRNGATFPSMRVIRYKRNLHAASKIAPKGGGEFRAPTPSRDHRSPFQYLRPRQLRAVIPNHRSGTLPRGSSWNVASFRDFNVQDTVTGCLPLRKRTSSGDVVNLGSGQSVSIGRWWNV